MNKKKKNIQYVGYNRHFAILKPNLIGNQSTGRRNNRKQKLYEIQYYHPWTLSRMSNNSNKFIMSDETCILNKVESSSPHLNKQVQEVWRRRPDRKLDRFFQQTTYLGPMGMLIGGFTKRTERPWGMMTPVSEEDAKSNRGGWL